MTKKSGYRPRQVRPLIFNPARLKHESDAWKRLIAFMMEENIYLKTRLTEALKNDTDPITLSEIETYHTRFIAADELIRLLRNDIAAFDRMLSSTTAERTGNTEKIPAKMRKLRDDISTARNHFEQLKAAFYRYLTAKSP